MLDSGNPNTSDLRVLIVEDSEEDTELLLRELRPGQWNVFHQRVETAQEMEAALDASVWDLIIADYVLPKFSGLAALALTRARSTDIPFLLISGQVGEEAAVQAVQAGADGYLFKGNLKRLVPVVKRELCDAEGRRKAEYTKRQLQKGERQLAEAQSFAHLGTWHVDLRTNIASWSVEAARILGWKDGNERMTFSQFLACVGSDDRTSIKSWLDSSDQRLIAQDCRIVCPNTATQFVHLRGEIVRDLAGRSIEAMGMIQDVTERRLLDAELRHAKEIAEAANIAKSQFLANMSHEIRAPMTAILGFADMLRQPNHDKAEQLEWATIIERNATYLIELINEILDLSKIEAHKVKVQWVTCDLPELLAEVAALMRPRATTRGLGFTVVVQGLIPRLIQSDPQRLRQILLNLLGNAIKFTEKGKIEIRVTEEQPGGPVVLLRIDVIDSGMGMAPEQLERLFRPFTQADETITGKFGGTGLGLTISRQLAQLLGGDVTVTSQPHVGSVFTLRINGGPSAGIERVHRVSEVEIPPVTNDLLKPTPIALHERILLVEDSADNQLLLQMQLRDAGASVVEALNGQIAVDLATTQQFDLILMDMQMPVMDGYAATAELRRRGLTLPIIALTANAMAEDREKCLASGCTDYLSKPIAKENLLRAIQQADPLPVSKNCV